MSVHMDAQRILEELAPKPTRKDGNYTPNEVANLIRQAARKALTGNYQQGS